MSALKKIFWSVFCLALLWTAAARAEGLNIIRDDEIEQALKTMALPVFQQAGLSPEAVRFVLVDGAEMNAFVAGGQNIFLFTRLILETQSPGELLGVIAHESGHIAGGHLFRGQEEASGLTVQAMLANLLGVAVAMGARSADAGIAIGSAANTIMTRQFLRHTRTQEGSADQAGVRFLQGAGLPVGGFLSFMKKLAAQELLPESQQSEYVQTHPLTQDRVDFLQRAVDEKPGGTIPPAWDEMHRRIKAKLLGYLFPDRALMARDDSVAGQYARAIAWSRKGETDKALATLAPLLKAEPDNPYFHELQGQIAFEGGRIEDSLPAYAQAVKLAPFSGLMRIAYARSLIESRQQPKENLAEAVRQLTVALDKEKSAAEAHHLLAIAYGKQGEEGLSRLHLAEEALLQKRKDIARREAGLAKARLAPGTPAWQRVQDILDSLDPPGAPKDGKKEKRD